MNSKAVIIFSVLVVQTLTEQCITPNNEQAECVPLYSCLVLIGALATQQNISIEFVRQSNCGGTGSNPMVCCGSSSNFTIVTRQDFSNERSQNVTKISLLPTRRYCGYQHSDDYFREENITATINEFPWMAFLVFSDVSKKIKPGIRCSGSLISRRYVLTAAHCIDDVRRYNITLVGVRLGDFNVKNETDCVEDSKFYECSDPVEELGIEEAVTHPACIRHPSANDIGLLRLNKTVLYSDYIRPICLPFPGTTFASAGDTLATSGWGKTEASGKLAESKKKILSRLISNEECAAMYNPVGQRITENHMCTSEHRSNMEFGCLGDTGGPVMFAHRYQWHQEGVSSFSMSGCGGKYPEVHTKVRNYLDWILENIRP